MFTLNQAKAAIANKTEFRCVDKGEYIVIDYNLMTKDTFVGSTPEETLILQNLRGTKFNQAGEIICLGYQKFHNLGETDGYFHDQIDLSQNHIILEKLDGSCIMPMFIGNYVMSFTTRAGITDVALKAHAFVNRLSDVEKANYMQLILSCLLRGDTPIFEYCARDQQIVVDYPEPMLVLTGIRNMKTGEYLKYSDMVCKVRYNFPYVKIVKKVDLPTDINEIQKTIRALEGEEGIVIRFDSGFMVKIKADAYVKIHRALESVRSERHVLELILANLVDDVLPLVDKGTHTRITEFRDKVLKNISDYQDGVLNSYQNVTPYLGDRKQYAQHVIKHYPEMKKFLFDLADGRGVDILDHVSKHTSTGARIESVRHIFKANY